MLTSFFFFLSQSLVGLSQAVRASPSFPHTHLILSGGHHSMMYLYLLGRWILLSQGRLRTALADFTGGIFTHSGCHIA